MKKEEKKVYPSGVSSGCNSVAGAKVCSTAGSRLAADNITFFTLKKPVVKHESSSSTTAAAVRLPSSPLAAYGRWTAAEASAAAGGPPVAARSTEQRFLGASCGSTNAGDAISLQGIRISRVSVHPSSTSPCIGFECRKKLSACSRADKQEALQRAREKLVWKGCVVGGNSRKGSSAGAAGSVSRAARRVTGKANNKKDTLLLTRKRHTTTTATSAEHRKRSGSKRCATKTGIRKRRRRKRRQLTAAQRAARRACLLREVRVSPQLLDVLLHTSAAAEIVHRQRQQQRLLVEGDTLHGDVRQQQTREESEIQPQKKQKEELRREDGGKRLEKQGERETGGLEQLQQQIQRGETTVRMSRPAVTRRIWQYVREQQLVTESDGCTVHADTRLQQLFGGRVRVNLFKELQSLLVPHLWFYEDNEVSVSAAEDHATDNEESDDGEEDEEAKEERSSRPDTKESEEEEDDCSIVFARRRRSHSSSCCAVCPNRYDGSCTDICGESRCSFYTSDKGERPKSAHAKEEAGASSGRKSATTAVIEGAANAGGADANAVGLTDTASYATEESIKAAKSEKKEQLNRLRGSNVQKEEQQGRPVRVKRRRRMRCLRRLASSSSSSNPSPSDSSRTSDNSDSSDSSASENDSSSISSTDSSSESGRSASGRSANSLRPRSQRRRRLIKEHSESSGSERGMQEFACVRNSSNGSSRGGNSSNSDRSSDNNNSSRTADVEAEPSRCTGGSHAPTLSSLDEAATTCNWRGGSNSDAASSDSDEDSNSSGRESQRTRRRDRIETCGSSNSDNRMTARGGRSGNPESCINSDLRGTFHHANGNGGERPCFLFSWLEEGNGTAVLPGRAGTGTPKRILAGGEGSGLQRPGGAVAVVERVSNTSVATGQLLPADGCTSSRLCASSSSSSSGRDSQHALGGRERENLITVNDDVKDERVTLSEIDGTETSGSAEATAESNMSAAGATEASPSGSLETGHTATEATTARAGSGGRDATPLSGLQHSHRHSGMIMKSEEAEEMTANRRVQKVEQLDKEFEAVGVGAATESEVVNNSSSDTRRCGNMPSHKQEQNSAEETKVEEDAAAAAAKQPLLRLRDVLSTSNRCECHRGACMFTSTGTSNAIYASPSTAAAVSRDNASGISFCNLSTSASTCCARRRRTHSDDGTAAAVCTPHAVTANPCNSCLWCRSYWCCCRNVATSTPPFIDAAGSIRTISRLSALVQLLLLDILPSSLVVTFEARPSRRLAAAVLHGKVRFYVSVFPCSSNSGPNMGSIRFCSSSMSNGSSNSTNARRSSSSYVNTNSSNNDGSRSENSSSSGISSYSSMSSYSNTCSSNNDSMNSSSAGSKRSYGISGSTSERSNSESGLEMKRSERGDNFSGACWRSACECDGSNGNSTGDEVRRVRNSIRSGKGRVSGPARGRVGVSENNFFNMAHVDDDIPVDIAVTVEEKRATVTKWSEWENCVCPAVSESEQSHQTATSTRALAAATARVAKEPMEPYNPDLMAPGSSYTTNEAQEGGNNTRRSVSSCSIHSFWSKSTNDTNGNSRHASSYVSLNSKTDNASSANASHSSSCDTSARVSGSFRTAEDLSDFCSSHEEHLWPVTVSVDRVLADVGGFRLRGRCDIKELDAVVDYRLVLHAVVVGFRGENNEIASQAPASHVPVSAARTAAATAHAVVAKADAEAASTAKLVVSTSAFSGPGRGTRDHEDQGILQVILGATAAPVEGCLSKTAGEASLEPQAEAGEAVALAEAAAAYTDAAAKADTLVATEAGEAACANAVQITVNETAYIRADKLTADSPGALAAAGREEENSAPLSAENSAQPLLVRASCTSAVAQPAGVGMQQQQTQLRFLNEEEQQKQALLRRTESTRELNVPLNERGRGEPEQHVLSDKTQVSTQHQNFGKQQKCQRQKTSADQAEVTGEGETDTTNQERIVVAVADAFLMQRAQPHLWNAVETSIFLQSLQVPHLAAAAQACQLQGYELMQLSDSDLLSLGVEAPVLRRRVLMATARLKQQEQSTLVSVRKQQQ